MLAAHNSSCEKQIILLVILNEEKEGCHYLVVKIIYIVAYKHLKT